MSDSDLHALPPGQQWVAPGKWPYLGERAPRADLSPWTIAVAGCVATPRSFTLAQLRELPWVERTIDIHCVTRWSKPAARFGGVRLAEVFDACGLSPAARFVSMVARTERQHSTSLPLEVLLQVDAIVALEFDGQALAVEHGGPARVVVPRRYFYKSLKWLMRLDVLEQDRLGYWEAQAGYHNAGDPWLQQRFMAPQLSKQEMQRILAARDFAGRDLRGLAARGHDLAGLDARGAVLRNADFRQANLQRARFDDVNLTLSLMQQADLRGASLVDADLEGVNFAGADLRGADFRRASLVAATFAEPGHVAQVDSATRFDQESLEHLTPEQREFFRDQLNL